MQPQPGACVRLTGKVAIVTGAASGIGRATAQRLAGEGALLVLADIQHHAIESFARELTESGVTVVARACDVSREVGSPGTELEFAL